MNDRYLYRAKRKNWRELPKEKWWVTGYLINKKCGKYNTVGFEEFEEMVIVTQFSDGGIDWCYIDKDTICQCTGLKDKNGKLIWENDIVNVSTNKGNTLCEVRYAGIVAHFQLWQFKTLPKTSTVLNLGNYEEEVIGNIFDNPELLEK